MSRRVSRNALATVSTTTTKRRLVIALGLLLAVSVVAVSSSSALRAKLGLLGGSKSSAQQQSLSAKAGNEIARLRHSKRSPGLLNFISPAAPTVSATKTDALSTDVDGDLQADPGDAIKYTVNISSAGEDATGVTFTDTVDPNTAFVAGSLRATPVAVDDSYSATGNIRISVAAPGVLGNDFAGIPSATITAPPVTSTNGGNVTLNADGSFTYNPPPGFEGTDTFSYTLTNSEGSNPATVSITVSGMIWFIDNNASCPCDGRLTNPFNTLASFQAVNDGAGNNPAANDNIFVYESAIDYVGPVTLLNGQRFLGQDATAGLSAMTGLTPPAGSDPLPATNSGNGTIVNITSGSAITVGSGNTLRGFTGGDSTTDITGSVFGTLTISDVTLNGTGQALNLATGTLAATFGSISSTNSGTTGVSLTSVAGTLTSPTTTITNPTGIGISVGTSSAGLNFGNTTSTGSGSTGVSLLTNSGTITFGALNISSDANQRGLLATDNSNTITSTSGAISTTGATAVEVTRTSGTTPLALTLTSVSASASAPNGIYLRNTSGSFTVNGDGSNTSVGGNSTGGSIANTVGADGAIAGNGVYLDNAGNVTLRRMTINGTNQNHGIRGINGNSGFTLEYSTVSGTNGTSTALDEGSVNFDNLTGSAAITSSVLEGGFEDNLNVVNTSGTLDRLVITASTFGFNNTTNGNNNILIESQNAGTILNFTLQSSIIKGARADWLNATNNSNSTMDAVVGGSTAALGNAFDNLGANAHPGAVSGGNRVVFGALGVQTLDIRNNTMKGSKGEAIRVRSTASGAITGTMDARVRNNTIGVAATANSGSSESNGIFVFGDGGSDMDIAVTDNQIFQYNNHGILLQFGDEINDGAIYNVTVTGNTVNTPGTNNSDFNGIHLNHGTVAATDNFTGCIDIGGAGALANNIVGSGSGVTPPNNQEFRLRQRQSTTVRLPGYGGGNLNTAAVIAYIQGRNVVTAGNGAASVQGTTGFVGGAACVAPSVLSALMAESGKGDSANYSEMRAPVIELPDTLRAARGEATEGPTVPNLTQSQISGVVQAAIERWRNAGISAEDLARLQSVTFTVANLPESQLATATSTDVRIDETAAGYGWYVDPTPMEDLDFDVAVPNRELQATEYSSAFGRMDLLTVVMRELGVVYRQGNSDGPEQLRSLMQNTLSPAVRRLPDSRNIQLRRSEVGVSRTKQSGEKKNLTARAGKASSKTGVGSSVSYRNTVPNPISETASRRSSRLMNHASRNMSAASPGITLADVMLNIGTLPAGESVTITFNVTVDNPFTGALPQVSNQGTVSGSNFADVLTDDPSVGGTADPTVTPIDLPQVSVAVSPASVAEDGATNLTYTFTRTGSTANPMTVNFSVGGSASFTEPDYTQSGAATFTATSGTVVIPASSLTATVTIDPSADTTVEPDETVDLTVTSGTGYTVGGPSSASGTITNDDTDVSVAVSPASVSEDGATNLTYTFTRTGVTTNSLTVNFSIGVGVGDATFPTDYSESGSTTFAPPLGTVTFAPSSSTAVVTIDPVADALVEGDETVIFTVTAGTGYNVGSPSSASGTITNDDAEVTVAVSPSSVTEDGATNLVYTFTRTGFTSGPLLVSFSVGGTAVFSEPDYSQSGALTYTDTSGTVLFGAGSSTAQVTIDPTSEANPEPDETVILTLGAGLGYTVGTPSSATGTILNDDTLVTVAVSPLTTAEGGANLVYTFTRTGSTASAVTVNFSVGGTASFPADYSQSGATTFTPPNATVTIGAGNSTATVNVTPLADCVSGEGPETVVFTVQPGAGYGVGSPSTATGTINDVPDTTPPVITLDPNRPTMLWPPNHDYHNFTVSQFVLSASDNCDPNVDASDVYIMKITSDEVEDGAGDGNTLNDMTISGDCKSFQLRAERASGGNGRVYTIHFKVVDAQGNVGTATATVTVRVNPNTPATDSGPVYTVISVCP